MPFGTIFIATIWSHWRRRQGIERQKMEKFFVFACRGMKDSTAAEFLKVWEKMSPSFWQNV